MSSAAGIPLPTTSAMVSASRDSSNRMASKQSPPTPDAGCHDTATSQPSICGTCCGSSRRWIFRASASSRCSAASSRRRVRPFSISRRSVASRWALSHGFCTKSRTPRRIASTARSTLPQPVITITGSSRSSACTRASRSIPSRPDVVSPV
jgi:hypothetical protein